MDWLNRLSSKSVRAKPARTSCTYVARAVASQMVADVRRANSPVIEELMAHLSDSRGVC